MVEKKNLKFDCSEWSLQFIEEPFKLFKLRDVFADPKHVEKLKKEVDCLSFSHKVTDILSFSQTKDLFHLSVKNKFILSEFLQFLHFFRKFLSKKFGVVLDSKISASCSKYSLGDFLLCHDDKIEDRYIAFIYYLNSSWDQTWGGSLDIFDHDENGQPSDVRYSFYPEGNTMIFFEVGNHTHHQVSEVLTSNDRITINGWFHSKKALEIEPLPLIESISSFVETNRRGNPSSLQELVNDEFVEEKYKELIVESIEQNGVIMMQNFLKSSFFEAISDELDSSSVLWIPQGPSNRKKYEIADLKKLPPKTKNLITYFQSNFMCSYLESISGLKFYKKITGREYVHLMIMEIQSWRRGCYSIMTHDDSNLMSASLDVLLFFNVANDSVESVGKNTSNVAGNIYYCEKESVAVKHEIEPNNNSICLVHKQKDETSFVPYISLNSNLKFHVIRLSFKL